MTWRVLLTFLSLTFGGKVVASDVIANSLHLPDVLVESVIAENLSAVQHDSEINLEELYNAEIVELVSLIISRHCHYQKLDFENPLKNETIYIKHLKEELNIESGGPLNIFESDHDLDAEEYHNHLIHETKSAGIANTLAMMSLACESLSGQSVSNAQNMRDNAEYFSTWKEEYTDEYERNGFVVVDEEAVSNIEELLLSYSNHLRDAEVVVEKLAFKPIFFSDLQGLENIGSEAIGVVAEDGKFQSLVTIYKSNDGLVSFEQMDTSNGNVTIHGRDEPNLTIGEKDILATVHRGDESGLYETIIVWSDQLFHREYTVRMNFNINDSTAVGENEVLRAIFDEL